ncbi:unnamed protein product [Paramecium primaurelia]|uniref:Uncharacterized protein n=1 Tax=Paramecium primaurelia TaxID=5886 RepID=A0A8S1Q8C5_PARPR|nr:unnamed protein product [Paramecium primaurelia]
MLVNQRKCMFCEKLRNDGSFHLILKRALYCKYSQSQNFFYEKDINDIIEDRSVKCTIHYKDHLHYNDQNEYMRRYYRFFESDDRLPALLEYYKYHINIPRNFSSKTINKRMERNREYQYLKIKQELGLCQNPKNIKQDSPRKVKDTSEDQSVSQMKNLLKDLKIESTQTDISSNSTILKDLVKMIGNNAQKPQPFQILNYNKFIQKQINPVIEAQKLQCKQLETNLLKPKENKTKLIKSPPLTERNLRSPQLSRQSSNTKIKNETQKTTQQYQQTQMTTTIKRPPQLKSRQASLGNIELTKSCQTTARNNPQQNELLFELAKKVFSTKIAINNNLLTKKKPISQQTNNFFVKGRSTLQFNLKNMEEIKSSIQSLNVRHKTPNQLIKSQQGTPNYKKKQL